MLFRSAQRPKALVHGYPHAFVPMLPDQFFVKSPAFTSENQVFISGMNSIRSRAEEIMLHELVYTEEVEDADS